MEEMTGVVYVDVIPMKETESIILERIEEENQEKEETKIIQATQG
jgi:hypothetical protein